MAEASSASFCCCCAMSIWTWGGAKATSSTKCRLASLQQMTMGQSEFVPGMTH